MISLMTSPIAFINVVDRERGVQFYRDVLGLDLKKSDDFGDEFTIGSATLRVTALPDWTPTGHPVLGWTCADLDQIVAALIDKGIVFIIYPGFGQDDLGIWTSPDGGTRLAWFNDVDGNVLMLSGS